MAKNIYKKIFFRKNNILILVLVLFILSQWLMVKMVYAHKITGSAANLLASVYQLKAGSIDDNGQKLKISLTDFLDNKNFARRLLKAQAASGEQFAELNNIPDQEISDLIWNKLLKQTWIHKVAKDSNISVTEDDVDYYINILGGVDKLQETIDDYGISVGEYKDFFIVPELFEAKVYDYLIYAFQDNKGVAKIQEAYAFLEFENGTNWQEAVDKYGEDSRLSDNTFWLSEKEMINAYEAVSEVEVGGFSKIVQVPGGYVIWHVHSESDKDGQKLKELSGLFVNAQSMDDFFMSYLNNVEVKRKY